MYRELKINLVVYFCLLYNYMFKKIVYIFLIYYYNYISFKVVWDNFILR